MDGDNTALILSKLWKDVETRRLFLCTAKSISLSGQIEETPTTTAPEKNPDMSISSERRTIADLRRAKLRFNTDQYYKIAVPSVYDLSRWITGLVRMYHGLPLKVDKRDAASAFRLLRLHHALALVVVTEFPASHVHMEHDLACFYLVMPFGWNGSPAHFARFGDAVTRAHNKCGLGRLSHTLMRHARRSVLYVDDGIFIEVNMRERLSGTTACWGHLTKGVLGADATNLDKLDEEGHWESQKILLGFTFDLSRLAITLPEEKMAGVRILLDHFFDVKRSQVMQLLEVQQLRGHMEHFRSTNEVWGIVKGPLALCLVSQMKSDVMSDFPNPAVWENFRDPLSIIETQCRDEDTWRALFEGELIR